MWAKGASSCAIGIGAWFVDGDRGRHVSRSSSRCWHSQVPKSVVCSYDPDVGDYAERTCDL